MKRFIYALVVFVLFTMISLGQNQTSPSLTTNQTGLVENSVYKLFPTQNYWTFIKLDTRNGKMWQVHFTVKDDGGRGQLSLNAIPLANKENEVIGRFTLHATNNIYNFILIDQIEGDVYQIQWSMEEEERAVFPIY